MPSRKTATPASQSSQRFTVGTVAVLRKQAPFSV